MPRHCLIRNSILLAMLGPGAAQGQELEIHLQEGDNRLRPLESVILQLRAFDVVEDEDGNKERVRVLPASVRFVLKGNREAGFPSRSGTPTMTSGGRVRGEAGRVCWEASGGQ